MTPCTDPYLRSHASAWLVDDDLTLVVGQGVAFATDQSVTVAYDENYFGRYRERAATEIGEWLNLVRCAVVMRRCDVVLDVGIGDGAFLTRWPLMGYGFDVNPAGIQWIHERSRWASPYCTPGDVQGITCWDSLEHMERPSDLLKAQAVGTWLFTSLPVFDKLGDALDLERLRRWRHFRPGEHLLYVTRLGFERFLAWAGYELVEYRDDETVLGRLDIGTFVARRVATTSVAFQEPPTIVEPVEPPKRRKVVKRADRPLSKNLEPAWTTSGEGRIIPVA